jgi:hypothetical protein
MSPLAVILPPTQTRDGGPVSMWPYIAICFASNTCVVGAAALLALRWGLKSPGLVGFVNASVSTLIPAWFFFRRHHRRFAPQERGLFLLGSFLAFWFYDEFLRIALMVARNESNGKNIFAAIVATIVDFALVGIIVAAIDLWTARIYRSGETEAPPNNRWRGP